jgi:ubiquinone/menaquinone biosynthesis C-methylase UbiE
MSEIKHKKDVLQQQYRKRFTKTEEYRNLLWITLCKYYFQKLIASDSTILDLGCGWGEFINNIDAKKKYAMDLNSDTHSKLNPDVNFIHQDCSHLWPVEENSIDVIFTSNFLEHLPDKAAIEQTLTQAKRSLKPGGKIILLGPNIKFLPGKYWDFWDHHVAISEKSIAEILTLKGFDVTTVYDRFLPFTMSDGNTPNIFLVKCYLNLPILWKMIGRQFLVIANAEQ